MVGGVSMVTRIASLSSYSGDMRRQQRNTAKQHDAKPRKSIGASQEDALLSPPTNLTINIRV